MFRWIDHSNGCPVTRRAIHPAWDRLGVAKEQKEENSIHRNAGGRDLTEPKVKVGGATFSGTSCQAGSFPRQDSLAPRGSALRFNQMGLPVEHDRHCSLDSRIPFGGGFVHGKRVPAVSFWRLRS